MLGREPPRSRTCLGLRKLLLVRAGRPLVVKTSRSVTQKWFKTGLAALQRPSIRNSLKITACSWTYLKCCTHMNEWSVWRAAGRAASLSPNAIWFKVYNAAIPIEYDSAEAPQLRGMKSKAISGNGLRGDPLPPSSYVGFRTLSLLLCAKFGEQRPTFNEISSRSS